jgi:ABC-type Mn2+/Zn2+ transport system ATPase subunit
MFRSQARITLARAIYSSAQLLLLDDVLAALDVHTAKWIVDECFKGDLIKVFPIFILAPKHALIVTLDQGRTVLLVVYLILLTLFSDTHDLCTKDP